MKNSRENEHGCLTYLLLIFAPPLAVIHLGFKPFIVTLLATIFGAWILGTFVGALYLNC